MTESLEAIVLATVRHSDRNNVVTLFTRSRGRIATVSPAGLSARGARRNALLMPLSVVEANISFDASRDLQRLGSIECLNPHSGIIGHPVKSAVTLFLADFLNHLLRESPPDEALYRYLVDSLQLLDTSADNTAIANFTPVFLYHLTEYVGIMPDTSDYSEESYFDLRAGHFTAYAPPHSDVLVGTDITLFQSLGIHTLSDIGALRLDVGSRRAMLRILMKYYAVHMPGIDSLKSLEVLTGIFG